MIKLAIIRIYLRIMFECVKQGLHLKFDDQGGYNHNYTQLLWVEKHCEAKYENKG